MPPALDSRRAIAGHQLLLSSTLVVIDSWPGNAADQLSYSCGEKEGNRAESGTDSIYSTRDKTRFHPLRIDVATVLIAKPHTRLPFPISRAVRASGPHIRAHRALEAHQRGWRDTVKHKSTASICLGKTLVLYSMFRVSPSSLGRECRAWRLLSQVVALLCLVIN